MAKPETVHVIDGDDAVGSNGRSKYKDRQSFAEYVKAHASDQGYLSREDERTLLRQAVSRYDIGYDEGRWIMLGVVADRGLALERDMDEKIRIVLKRFADTNDRISEREFKDAVEFYKGWSQGGMSESEIRRKLKAIMVENDWKGSRKGFLRSRRWFRRIDSD